LAIIFLADGPLPVDLESSPPYPWNRAGHLKTVLLLPPLAGPHSHVRLICRAQ
jgi:hypothetical protein